MNIISAIRDKKLFAPFFKDASTWGAWLTFLRALFALPLSDAERKLFEKCTGRQTPLKRAASEAALICGRRSGKSFVAAVIAAFLAAFKDYRAFLSPGEVAIVAVLAVDRDQAQVILRYIRALFEGVPMLTRLVARETADSIELTKGVTIEVRTASYRSVRGRTIVAALCDEIAFWRADDSANPAEEVLAAIRPAMATVHPHGLLLMLSSPYSRSGPLYEAHARHFGQDSSDVLVWRAPTQVMNPTIPQEVIDREFERDPQSAKSEFGDADGIEFRSDVSAAYEFAWIDGATDPGCALRPPSEQFGYHGFVDVSGGKRDSYCLAIAHRQGDTVILDIAREWRAPLDPAAVTEEVAKIIRPYRLTRVMGDAYAGEWPISAYRQYGIAYSTSERNRSDLYREFGALLARGGARLLDVPRLANQLKQLERRTSPGGRDRIDHGPNGQDDLANAVAGAIVIASERPARSGRDPRQAIKVIDDWSPFS